MKKQLEIIMGKFFLEAFFLEKNIFHQCNKVFQIACLKIFFLKDPQ